MSTSDTEQDYLWTRRHLALDRVQLSVCYHRKRERFFDLVDRSIKGIAIFGGSAALARLGGDAVLPWAAGIVTISSTVSLVFGLADRSRRHSELARQFIMLEADIVAKGERDYTEDNLNHWDAAIRSIEASEPPALRYLIIACQNEIAIANNQAEFMHPIPWWRRPIMHLF